MASDKQIWDDFRQGESYALSHIYHQNVQLLFRYGKKFSKDDEMVKDTIQDLFLDLIRTKNNLGDTDNIQFYLLCAFRRKLIRNIKKQGLSVFSENGQEIDAEIVYSIEKELIEKEELTARERSVQAALNSLSAKQREILFYRYSCDFDYEEICDVMKLQYDSARKQMFRALKSLKAALAPHYQK